MSMWITHFGVGILYSMICSINFFKKERNMFILFLGLSLFHFILSGIFME
jgi:hypothetical protein